MAMCLVFFCVSLRFFCYNQFFSSQVRGEQSNYYRYDLAGSSASSTSFFDFSSFHYYCSRPRSVVYYYAADKPLFIMVCISCWISSKVDVVIQVWPIEKEKIIQTQESLQMPAQEPLGSSRLESALNKENCGIGSLLCRP